MQGFLLQPWITVRGDATVTTITQDEEEWLDLGSYADAVFWVEILEFSGAAITINFETSPTVDDSFFGPVSAPLLLSNSPPLGTPIAVSTIRTASTSPFSKWLRWRLSIIGAMGSWSVTFRVRVIPGHSTIFAPTDVSGCVLWLRSDLGIVLNTDGNVSSWKDQSGIGNDATNGRSSPAYSRSGVRNLPKITQAGTDEFMTGAFTAASVLSTYSAFAVVRYPSSPANNGSFAGTSSLFALFSGFTQNCTATDLSALVSTIAGAESASTSDLTSVGQVGIYALTVSSAPTVVFYVNGIAVDTTALDTLSPATIPNYVLLACSNASPVDYPLNGDAYEYIIFNRVLTSSEITQIHRYLGGRYGLTVS